MRIKRKNTALFALFYKLITITATISLIALSFAVIISAENDGIITSDNTSNTTGADTAIDSETNTGTDTGTGTETDIIDLEEDSGRPFKLTDILLIPMGFIIRICYSITGNYALALLLFAIIMQLFLLPLGIKQQKNNITQARLRPKELAIRKKYAGRNDPVTKRKVNEEILALYQEEHFNPAGGCLPLLVQLPIIFALFAVVKNPLTYICRFSASTIAALKAFIKSAGVTLTVGYEEINIISYVKEHSITNIPSIPTLSASDIAGMPDLTMFNGAIDLSAAPSSKAFLSWIMLIPVLTFVVILVSQKITKKFTYRPDTDDSAQSSMKIMEWMMPLMSVYFAYIVPAAIGLYWIYRNILALIQQVALAKIYPLPHFTEEELKAAEREYLGKKRPAAKGTANPNRPKVRSLHRIDEDDDDQETAIPAAVNTGKKEQNKNKPSIIEAAPLKSDRSDSSTTSKKSGSSSGEEDGSGE
ncbi:MAG: YidC/Oxa1 family membrane protein insertase [Eubacteriales bacterium]|jgi:YidC/Oxa1 family membrane protein insertase|nr:YidC/Oxa1 family membrane protein insertase [Clostridiales bacterium]